MSNEERLKQARAKLATAMADFDQYAEKMLPKLEALKEAVRSHPLQSEDDNLIVSAASIGIAFLQAMQIERTINEG
jgi:hypothetical protein